jgi:hypothetical protein
MEKLMDFLMEQTLRDKVISIINHTIGVNSNDFVITDDNEVVNSICEYTKDLIDKIESSFDEGGTETDVIYNLLDLVVSNHVLVTILRKYIDMVHKNFDIDPEI